jgi:hypothetical protein
VDFIGFARIPGMRTSAPAPAASEESKPVEPPKETAESGGTAKPRSTSSAKKSKPRK